MSDWGVLPGTITEALAEMGRLRPSAVAIEIGGEAPTTYLDLFGEAQRGGARLAAAGLRPGQGVLVVTRARARVPALVHAALLGGGVVVSIEPSTPPAQLRSLAERAHCAFALGDPDLLDWLAPRTMGPLNPARPQDPHVACIADPPPIAPPLDPPGHLPHAVGAAGVRDLHVGIDGRAEGRPALAREHARGFEAHDHRARAPPVRSTPLVPLVRAPRGALHVDRAARDVRLHGRLAARPATITQKTAIASARPTFVMGVPAEWQALATAATTQHGGAAEIRTALGLDRVRLAMSTGAPLAPAVHKQLFGLGLLIHEMYGMTETSGAATYNPPGDSRSGSVGVALPGSRVALDDDGEVLLYGDRYRCLGYLDDVEGTNKLYIGEDGVRTGDLGSLDEEGYLYVTGRKKDLLVLSTGKKVHPSSIEAQIAALPGIRHAAVFGEGHHHLVAVIDAVNDPRLRTAPMTVEELRQHLTVHLVRLNTELGKHERIAAVGVAPQPFSIAGAELTPSLKVKRETVRQRHGTLIDALLGKHAVPPGIGDILRFDDG